VALSRLVMIALATHTTFRDTVIQQTYKATIPVLVVLGIKTVLVWVIRRLLVVMMQTAIPGTLLPLVTVMATTM
jgi:hypothetical protein